MIEQESIAHSFTSSFCHNWWMMIHKHHEGYLTEAKNDQLWKEPYIVLVSNLPFYFGNSTRKLVNGLHTMCTHLHFIVAYAKTNKTFFTTLGFRYNLKMALFIKNNYLSWKHDWSKQNLIAEYKFLFIGSKLSHLLTVLI